MLNQEKIGKFIAERRKNQNMTQRQLAESLGVSDKAVSKWETGKSMPDNSLLMELCANLEINVNELLSGEKLSDDNYLGKAEENMANLIGQTEKEKKKHAQTVISAALGAVALFVILFFIVRISVGDILWYLDWPSLLSVVAIVFVVLLMSGMAMDFVRAFLICFGRRTPNETELKRALAASKLVLVAIPVAGILVSLVAYVAIFGHALAPEYLGPSLAVAILTILYSLILELLFLPIAGRLWAMEKK